MILRICLMMIFRPYHLSLTRSLSLQVSAPLKVQRTSRPILTSLRKSRALFSWIPLPILLKNWSVSEIMANLWLITTKLILTLEQAQIRNKRVPWDQIPHKIYTRSNQKKQNRPSLTIMRRLGSRSLKLRRARTWGIFRELWRVCSTHQRGRSLSNLMITRM